MNRKKMEKSWERTRAHLDEAFAQLPASPINGEEGGSIGQYREWIAHNELELALDELEMIGQTNQVTRKFWECLLQAATRMQLKNHMVRYHAMLHD